MEIRVRNVNYALPLGVLALKTAVPQESRNGPVLEVAEPVLTIYDRPQEKVLFCKTRDANPFLHFFESLWILAGRQDVAFLSQFTPQMKEYSDDGVTFHAAYGQRLRSQFGENQLHIAIDMLKSSPESRRVVLQIWGSEHDLGTNSKDLPCNTTLYLLIRGGHLHMTVCCRSNDMLWGAYGANVVQFGTLMEYLAGMIGVKVGTLRQLSNSFHVYTDLPLWQKCLSRYGDAPLSCFLEPNQSPYVTDYYTYNIAHPYPLVTNAATFDQDLHTFFADMDEEIVQMFPDHHPYTNQFFPQVAHPLWAAWGSYKHGDAEGCLAHAGKCAALDWRLATIEWLKRRKLFREQKGSYVPST